MTTLTAVLSSLLARPDGGAVRLRNGLAIRYTPAGVIAKAAVLSLSRPAVAPSPTEVQVVINHLAQALKQPGIEVVTTEAGPIVRRIYFTVKAPAVCPEHEEPLPCPACHTLLIMADKEETPAV